MSDKLIGVVVGGERIEQVLQEVDRAEELGIPAGWMTTGGTRIDSLTAISVAATRTQKIKFGTAIVPTFPRHPLVMVQQVQVLAQLARAVSAWA